MENIPPSYEAAIARNPWRVIAPYIPSAELCALSRVSRSMHEIFAPYLWGNPASHFGTENDRVYVALTRFKRILKRVRLRVSELTHTLHLPPAQSEIYDGPRPEWLRDVLEQLPNLQSLLVSSLPFFDHMALIALQNPSNGQQIELGTSGPIFPLRLLIASRCQNTTSQGLAEALEHFPHLAFLDLSNTSAARDEHVLSTLGNLPLLQVVKMRNVNLRDEDIEILAGAIGIRVRSLDVQGNHLTDRSVSTLLDTCFQGPEAVNGVPSNGYLTPSNIAVDDWPSGFVKPDSAVLDEFRDESYDERFVRRLTCGITSRLPYEDMPPSGITHLYIAENHLTIKGLALLIRSTRLYVLDAGSLHHGTTSNNLRPSSYMSTSPYHSGDPLVSVSGIEKLTPVMSKFASSMTSLRIHHSIVTECVPAEFGEPVALSEVSGEGTARPELEVTLPDAAAHEMDATPPLYELEPRNPVSRFELPGDSFHLVVSPPIGKKPSLTKEESEPEVQSGGAFAPEVVQQRSDDDESAVLTATGLGTMANAVNGIANPSPVTNINGPSKIFDIPPDSTRRRLGLINKQRRELRSNRLDKPHGLIPGMMTNLRTLTLTEVPSYTRGFRVIEAIILYIKDCASEAHFATLQACLEPDQLRKPGERQSKHSSHHVQKLFALRRIVLEMAPAISPDTSRKGQISSFSKNTKSSTEDADSEALWSAAENDFTFFDDDEECGLPSVETDSHVPYHALSEKIVMPNDGSQIRRLPTLQRPKQKENLFDVVQELAKFRKERKAAYEDGAKRGLKHVDGYWPGEVKIVREHRSGGRSDYYGNHFGKLGVYR